MEGCPWQMIFSWWWGAWRYRKNKLKKSVQDVQRYKISWISFYSVFICARKIFGLDIPVPKNAITELYKNLSYKTLSGARNLEFSAVSDLILEISFQIKRSTLLNRKRKEEDEKINVKIKEEHGFFLTTWWIWGGTGRGPV